MDIIAPSLAWVNGACYRLNKEAEFVVTRGYTGEEFDDGDENGTANDAELDLRHPIEERGGGFRASVAVASTFFSMVIGKGGAIKSRLEAETRTRIIIPKRGMEGDIVITGQDRRGVVIACNRIDVIVFGARNKQPFTHFISLPANGRDIQARFSEFKSRVLETCSQCAGVEESIFQTATLLHLTVGTMALMDDRERQMARDMLQDCKEQIVLPLVGENPFRVRIRGLEIMNDDPAEVDVLYGKIEDTDGSLQTAAEQIVDKFVASGLMKREYDRVKFHVTLMNTLFRRDKNDVGDRNDKGSFSTRESFDSRAILDQYGDFDFGEMAISELHLSQRRAGRRTAEGYYLPSMIVKLTTCG